MDKSCSWVQGEQGALAVLLRGVPIPLAATFCSLTLTSPLGAPRPRDRFCPGAWRWGGGAVARLPHLSTYDR